MAKNLFIVESPAKAKTIEKFLGKDFTVKSSIGHIRDLVESGMGVDVKNNFLPSYVISPDKKQVVSELKKLSKDAETIWLATDEDREGEAIAWHLLEALELNEKKTKRIVYHEITKQAILDAIANPRSIDRNLVDAQQARRVLDRLVGYELSPVLWKKVKPSLSAGRVQSVAVRLIVEREREISSFKSKSAYKVTAAFIHNGTVVTAELSKKFDTAEQVKEFLQKCAGATFQVENVETKPAKRSPSAPFTTSTLQQEASRKLGFSVAQTMLVAQRLYESGKITYMRTDSVNLSGTAIGQAKNEIQKLYGEKYLHVRQYKSKAKGAQEAHEAIRPSYLEQQSVDGDRNDQRLYELIWKRTIASQMSDAELEKTTVTITASGVEEKFYAQGEMLKFDGFLKVYAESSDEENEEGKEGLLPVIRVGEKLALESVAAIERYTHYPPRYTEASLVKKLEELGIGRPSTYAPTISTVQKRGYVVKEDRQGISRNYNIFTLKNGVISEEVKTEMTGVEKAKLFPTDVGMVVNDFLANHFREIMDYNFTARVEEEFDEIAEGRLAWTKMLDEFYTPFHKTVEVTTQTSERASGERLLGNDPVSGKKVIVRIGRFGPMVQMGETSEEEKPRFASLRNTQRMESLTLEEALDLFKLPRTIGQYQGEDIVVSIGRFGPYIRHAGIFYSLGKQDDPYTITLDRAIEILNQPKLPRELGNFEDEKMVIAKGRFGPYIKHKDAFYSLPRGEDPFTVSDEMAIEIIRQKREKDAQNTIKTFVENNEVKILNGRYGPYILAGKKNVRIPAGKTPGDLTLQECLDLAAKQEDKPRKGKVKKEASKPEKAPAKKITPPKKASKRKK